METKSNGLLKVTGILMIIGGGLGIILNLISVFGMGIVVESLNLAGGNAILWLLTLAAILSGIGSAISLIAGIMGVKNAAKPEKATVCIVFGFLTALLSILGNILTAVGGGSFGVIYVIIGLVLPVLYLIGAFQNKKRAIAA
ncbi:MAG: hypothetical protein LBS18_07575 [Clostridiales bacterium]|jgi:hypothetical protein|nr:hypothetical protein [Clostridiales bacterium]